MFSEMVRFCLRGNFSRATRLYNIMLPLMNYNFVESNPIPVKAALAMMGKIQDAVRLPLTPLNKKFRPGLKNILRELDLVR
jgi:4-hydroxy-tetrahydrodipicolinate synthase